ncbi:MAG: cell division protein ZipA [Gammaproteobacteria bacterium]|jgi:cell division protein ZipA
MDDLRLILLLVGALVILGIYAWGRFQATPRKPRPRTARRSASAVRRRSEEPDDADIRQELQRMQAEMNSAEAEQAPAPAPAEGNNLVEPVLVLSVVATSDRPFTGSALRKAFANNSLSFGDKSIFHRLVRKRGEDVSVFGVANMLKPGNFGTRDLAGFSTRGITLFLQFPAPIDGLEAFDDFVQTAERLAVELGGELQDRKRNVISHQTLMQMREQLAASHLRAPLAS